MSSTIEAEKKQLLRSADILPTSEALEGALGGAYKSYTDFLKLIESRGIKIEWRYYTDGKAWLGKGLYQWITNRGAEKEKTGFWLSVWEGCFKLSFFFSVKLRAEIIALPLEADTIKRIEEAGQMGKLKFFPLVIEIAKELPKDLGVLMEYRKKN